VKRNISLLNSTIDFLKKDVSLSLTLGYVVLISLGILFNSLYYSYFGIDILAYCDLTDHLITPIREPSVLIFFIANLGFFYLISLFDGWLKSTKPVLYQKLMLGINDESTAYLIFKELSFVITLLVYVYMGTKIICQMEIERLEKPGATHVDMIVRGKNESLDTSRHILIGKTGSYLIVKADTSRKKAIIYPMESIHSIRYISAQP